MPRSAKGYSQRQIHNTSLRSRKVMPQVQKLCPQRQLLVNTKSALFRSTLNCLRLPSVPARPHAFLASWMCMHAVNMNIDSIVAPVVVSKQAHAIQIYHILGCLYAHDSFLTGIPQCCQFLGKSYHMTQGYAGCVRACDEPGTSLPVPPATHPQMSLVWKPSGGRAGDTHP